MLDGEVYQCATDEHHEDVSPIQPDKSFEKLLYQHVQMPVPYRSVRPSASSSSVRVKGYGYGSGACGLVLGGWL